MFWKNASVTTILVVIFLYTFDTNTPKDHLFLRRSLKSQTNSSSISYEEGLRAWGSSMEYFYTERDSQQLDQRVLDYFLTIDEDDIHEPEDLVDPRRSDDYVPSQDDVMNEVYQSFLTSDLLFDNVDDYRDDDANEVDTVKSTSMDAFIAAYEDSSSEPVISITPLHELEPKGQSLCGFLMLSAVALVLGASTLKHIYRAVGLYVDRCCFSGIDELVVSIESPSLDIRASELMVPLVALEVWQPSF